MVSLARRPIGSAAMTVEPARRAPQVNDVVRGHTSRGRPASPWRPAVLLAVAAGGLLGGPARYAVERLLPAGDGSLPWGTLTVNVVGSAVLGLLLMVLAEVWPPRRYLRPFAAVGFLGSFTTFSTWMVEVDRLATQAQVALAVGYLLGSLVTGLLAAAAGLAAGRFAVRRLTRRPH